MITFASYMKLTKILLVLAIAAFSACSNRKAAENTPADDDTLVIIHTNDTHSNIDPIADSDMGGVLRRQVLIDSIRKANQNVLLIDAGDIVQGTLYFHLYKGKVEQEVLNRLGYDIQILGNHEFDNGMEALHDMLANANPTLLSSNYDLTESTLDGMFEPWTVKQYGNRKVGIFALNLDPKGMVAEGNYDGVKYLPWKEATERTVDLLRNREGCDFVIAVTHIGFSASAEKPDLFGDVQVAEQTSGIDLIIGGHSHTRLEPAVRVANALGDSVTIVQTGKYGQYLGETTLNLASGAITDKLIAVDSRLDSRRDPELMAALEPYRTGIDSLYNRDVALLKSDGPLTGRTIAMQNFAADFVRARGLELAGRVDGSISNKGGLRTTWHPGAISEGAAIDMMPFANKVRVIDLKGSDLLEALDVMKARQDYAVSLPEQIDANRIYRIATIDYLANGGDYMTALTRGKTVAESRNMAYSDLLDYLKKHPVIVPDTVQRLR